MTERPVIDYINLPHMPREGIQAEGSNRYLTRSLFIETAPEALKPDAIWTMAEHEVYAYDKWYPSAWMAYIYSIDEYDAARKICGNVRQWKYIKEMFEKTKRLHILESWQEEHAALQRSIIRDNLEKTMAEGRPGATAAAKMLLQMTDKPLVGRPKKAKPKEETNSAAEAAASRVVNFQK